MNSTWADYGYEKVLTGDGSPSLKSLASPESEVMHHRGGALTESREIYGRLITPAFGLAEPRFLSVGLGLGYNEILIAERSVQSGRPWACVSYEADPRLTGFFLDYLEGRLPEGEIRLTYDTIFKDIERPAEVRARLLEARAEGRWRIEGALTNDSVAPAGIHGFLWDAFSQKTSPELWREEFLTDFIARSADPAWAALTTYACIGKLKRALRANGFTVEIRGGFSGKRNSTFATRDRLTPSAAGGFPGTS